MKKSGSLFFFFLFLLPTLLGAPQESFSANDFDLPLHITPLLSANFGELREDHFHSGLDFKTQGAEGKGVYAVADGWVSRICIRAKGYGKAVYIDHPNGYTSVYAHLKDLCPALDSVLKEAQYASQSYEQNLLFDKGTLCVSRGTLIAWSGNTGSSGGPHLHFEIRQTSSENPMDPLLWYKDRVIDNEKPRLQALAIYAAQGEGCLRQNRPQQDLVSSPQDKVIIPYTDGNQTAFKQQLPEVWGKIGIGLKAYNYMTGTRNIYGVQLIRLFLEEASHRTDKQQDLSSEKHDSTLFFREIFRQDLSRISFDESRYINALVDYEEWIEHRSWIMKSFIDGENRLDIYPVLENNGWIDINEERPYHFRYELSDRNGNTTSFDFYLQGKKMPIEPNDSDFFYFYPPYENEFIQNDIELTLPAYSLYKELAFDYRQTSFFSNTEQSSAASNAHSSMNQMVYSDLYKIHHPEVPLHKKAEVRLRIQHDNIDQKNQYYLASYSENKGFNYAGGKYDGGFIESEISSFGNYVVLADSLSPKIIFPNVAHAIKNNLLRVTVQDTESGIAGYCCSIDGKWVLFEDDYKRNSIFSRFDALKLQQNNSDHILEVRVWDHCGNESKEKLIFHY